MHVCFFPLQMIPNLRDPPSAAAAVAAPFVPPNSTASITSSKKAKSATSSSPSSSPPTLALPLEPSTSSLRRLSAATAAAAHTGALVCLAPDAAAVTAGRGLWTPAMSGVSGRVGVIIKSTGGSSASAGMTPRQVQARAQARAAAEEGIYIGAGLNMCLVQFHNDERSRASEWWCVHRSCLFAF
jgi:hypothetical protein